MKQILTLTILLASTIWSQAQQVNPVPDYVFRNQMSVGRNAVTDTAAYFSIGPRYGATKGFMPPIVGDTATFSSGKRNGLLIFSVQKNKFLYWDSVRVQWSDMAGSSGTYITGSGITGYVPQFNGTTTIDTSALFTIGNRLGVGTSSFAYNTTSTANVELNGTAGGIVGFKRNDSARGYLWHTGTDMELANTTAGTLSFNTNSATRGSISSAGVWRLHNLAGTGDRVVVASSNGTLSASTSVTGLVDTLTLSTRAWRQKGIDSLAAIRIAGSGTINRSAKFTAGGTIGNGGIADSSSSVAMTILSSGNVGVGTQAPSSRLHVSGGDVRIDNTHSYNFTNSSGGTSSARLQMFSDNNLYIDNPDGALNFRTQSFESAMVITNAKNVGIGTTTPSQKLDVLGIITNNNSAYFATFSGNVGIGTTSPSQKLSVNGIGAFNTRLVFNGFNQLVGDGNQFNDGGGISGFGIRNDSGQVMLAAGGNTPQLRVSKSGEILINTNTDAGDYKLQVAGNIYNTGSLTTGAPSGGSIKPWKLGSAATVSPTSPNRTIQVELDGVVYYLHAKTTND